MFLLGTAIPVVIASCIIHVVTSQGCGSLICPDTWTTRNRDGNCYYSSLKSGVPKETYFRARRRCQKDGGDLVILSDNDEYLYIRRELNNEDPAENVWIGACWSDERTRFQYINGTVMPRSADWLTVAPLSDSPAFGAVFRINNRALADGRTNTTIHYICEKDRCLKSSYESICSDPMKGLASSQSIPTSSDMANTTTGWQSQTTPTASTSQDNLSPATTQTSMWPNQNKTGGYPGNNDGGTINLWIGIGVALLVVLIVVLILIVCVIRRKRKNNEENNLSMKTKLTEHRTSSNIPIGASVTSKEEQPYTEPGYAEVNTQTGTNQNDKDVLYDTAIDVDVGMTSKEDNNDTAMYATPVKNPTGMVHESEKVDYASDEDNTEIVENSIYEAS